MYLKATFDNGFWASARRGGTREQHEWPPSPWRLFNMLVNGHYVRLRSGQTDDGHREALLTLEQQRSPIIYATEAEENNRVHNYVPVEDEKRLRYFPAVFPHQSDVYFHWPRFKATKELRDILDYCTTLGTARSFASFEIGDELPILRGFNKYQPDRYGDLQLPTYWPGTLEELDINYESRLLVDCLYENYSQMTHTCSAFQNLRMFKLAGPWKPPLQEANLLADRVRAELLRICDEINVQPNAIIAKDDRNNPRPHVSYIPLPFAGHSEASGDIYGVAIGIPRELGPGEHNQVMQAIGRLVNFKYQDQHWGLESIGQQSGITLRRSNWVGPSKIWTTITPVEVQWKPDDHCIEYLIKQCESMGLPHIKKLELGDFNFQSFKGMVPARRFLSRNSRIANRVQARRLHAKIEFEDDVYGPLLLGKGRYFGMGLFQPFERLGAVKNDGAARMTESLKKKEFAKQS